MPEHKDKLLKIIRFFQIISYLLFVTIWFKDSFPFLKQIPVSPLVALIPLVTLTLLRLAFKAPDKRIRISPALRRDILVLILIVLAATAVRIPYLIHNYGLMDSDEAIPALMGKHIAEGKLPPLYYYAAFFQGSLPQHYHALIFWIFGYSVFMAKLSAFLSFVAFLGVHFFLLKKIFSFGFACLMGLFYCLPLPHLITSSFDIGSGFPVVFFLGSLIFFLTYSIAFENEDKWLPALGFVMGLAFWTHQISVIFILTASFFLVTKFKARLKKYLPLLIFFGIGAFPVLMNEVYRKFVLVKFLFPGGSGSMSLERLTRFRDLTLSLISSGPGFLDYLYLALIAGGVFVLVVFSWQKRKILPSLLFPVYFVSFSAVYILSDFSSTHVIRYLYILYLVLPVLLGSVFLFFKTRVRYPVMAVFFLLAFFLSNGEGSRIHYSGIKEIHGHLEKVQIALEETGKKFWMSEYWTSYLLTAISKEKIIVASYTVRRYYPYGLLYYNQPDQNNFIFLRGPGCEDREMAENLLRLLDTFGISYKKETRGDTWLVYDIKSPVYPTVLVEPVPAFLPRLRLVGMQALKGYLHLKFANSEIREDLLFRLNVEIPGFSNVKRQFMGTDGEISLRIPFPEGDFPIRYYLYYLDFKGLVIPESEAEVPIIAPDKNSSERRARVVYLSGFSGARKFLGRKMRICEKNAVLEINGPRERKTKVRLYLYSPFEFSQWYWYGDYSQTMKIRINGVLVKEVTLKDGENLIEFDLDVPSFKEGRNLIGLEFTYHHIFEFASLWKTAMLMERVEIEENSLPAVDIKRSI